MPGRLDVLLRHRVRRADLHPANVRRAQPRGGLRGGHRLGARSRGAPRVAAGAPLCCRRAGAGAGRGARARAGAVAVPRRDLQGFTGFSGEGVWRGDAQQLWLPARRSAASAPMPAAARAQPGHGLGWHWVFYSVVPLKSGPGCNVCACTFRLTFSDLCSINKQRHAGAYHQQALSISYISDMWYGGEGESYVLYSPTQCVKACC